MKRVIILLSVILVSCGSDRITKFNVSKTELTDDSAYIQLFNENENSPSSDNIMADKKGDKTLPTEIAEMTAESKYEKILFRYHSNVLDKITVETMWAEKVDQENGIYKLSNIPFYGPPIATDDEFFAEYDSDEHHITYRKTTKYSENTVVLILITNKQVDVETVREEFKGMNCASEKLNDSYFAMEILASTDYGHVQQRLKSLKSDGTLEYSEPCLSDKHRTDLNGTH